MVPTFSYQRPLSLAELWSLHASAEGPVSLLAGGTDLVPALKRGTVAPAVVIDVKRLLELGGIRVTPQGGLRLGALTTLHGLARSREVLARYPTLAVAADTVASYQIRNRGTLGGNLCLDTRCSYFNQSAFWRREYPDCRKMGGGSCYVVPRGDRCHALSSSDLAPLLIAYAAEVEVASPQGIRRFSLEDIFADDGLHATTLRPGEVLAHVLLPPPLPPGVVYRRFATRESIDFPMLSVALAGDEGGTRVVVGHVASRPLRAPGAETALAACLAGKGVDPREVGDAVADELPLTSSVRGSVAYKKHVLRNLTAAAAVELAVARERGA